ncbi:hypothetical protein GLOIN_2v1817388 [Rhizophagus clarus]|uniref:Uncharacterized protein n=1 Tax=Rhizophagus clarus TaxID=94130 RepID=A0A8H3KRD8_9GLOM|nr:hypothetical protein GLOIN_2v1817388 [Rhizophagus clarus]
MRQKSVADEEIDQFEADIKQWISDFCRPTIGNPNSVNQQVGMYLRMCLLSMCLHFQFMRFLKQKGMKHITAFLNIKHRKENSSTGTIIFGGWKSSKKPA